MTQKRLNVYQLVLQASTEPVFVRRNSWREGVAEIVGTLPAVEEWRELPAPYYGNPKVIALIKYRQGEPYELAELSGPGTYAYEPISPPIWWRQGVVFPVVGRYKLVRLTLSEHGLTHD
jgi:hypothetical protein